MTAPLTGTEFAAMESLLGKLVDHCDQRQQLQLLRLHERLTVAFQKQSEMDQQLDRLRLVALAKQPNGTN